MNLTTPSTYDGTSTPVPGTPTPAGRGRGAPLTLPYANTKRGRKPTTRPGSATTSPLIPAQDFKVPMNSFYQSSTPSSWATTSSAAGPSSSTPTSATFPSSTTSGATGSGTGFPTVTTPGISGSTLSFLQNNPNPTTAQLQSRLQQLSMPGVDFAATATRSLNLSRASTPSLMPGGSALTGAAGGGEEEGEDDELLPAMADDDYSAQLSWQSQSKDNLKVLMDNLTEAQYDRFEAYRRHALPKQGVRKVIQQTLGQQVSQPVAQIVAGFSKVFVGEMVEKARAVQARRGETGPLSPDHLREAYRLYQEESGRVGAARPLRGKKLFVR